MAKVAFFTLGCKVNQYDTRLMIERFIETGWEVVQPVDAPDVVVINSCTVTKEASRQSRQMVRKFKREIPGVFVALVGCLPEALGEQTDTEADLLLGTDKRRYIVEEVEQRIIGERQIDEKEVSFIDWTLKSFPGRTRAFLKVQDGCAAFCSYCIVPYVRGPVRSKRPEKVKMEVEGLVERGFKEIVLTGIHLGAYGSDLNPQCNLKELIKLILTTNLHRLRLSSIEVNEVDEELLYLLAENPSLCPHLHLPLQSGSKRILKLMNRNYSPDDYLDLLGQARTIVPELAYTTDVIVGFPGEEEEDFQATVATVLKAAPSRIHVFPFSPRKGTPAATMVPQVSNRVKKERGNRLRALGEELAREYRQSLLGKMLEVLVEERHDQYYTGTTPHYLRVYARGETGPGEIINLKAITMYQDGLWGEEV